MVLDKFSIVVTTRCNLRCELCDEFIPANKPFEDLSVEETKRILSALFDVVDYVNLLHLSGGGEPFLNKNLAKMITACFDYADKFERLMVFTNSTVLPTDDLLDVLEKHKDKIVVHASNYGLRKEISEKVYGLLRDRGILLREVKYYGEEQDYGGWVDFGEWDKRNRSSDELNEIFKNCGITKYMHGNWRTRDGKIHWCQRSQRGMELGILDDDPDDYVDLFDDSTGKDEKIKKFQNIMQKPFLSSCDHCSGNHGTEDVTKRFPAGKQISND